jgi:transposase
MDRDALAELERDALIALVLRQQALIGRLTARVAELEATRGGPPKGPGNSSLPPAQGRKPNRPERRGKKRGPKRGHPGTSRVRQRPDVVLRCRPTACAGCGAALGMQDRRRARRSQVVELPDLRPVVLEVWAYAARCGGCRERTVAAVPAGFGPGRTFGPRIEALLAYLHHGHHLSHERLVAVCASVLGLPISRGLAAATARSGEADPKSAATCTPISAPTSSPRVARDRSARCGKLDTANEL